MLQLSMADVIATLLGCLSLQKLAKVALYGGLYPLGSFTTNSAGGFIVSDINDFATVRTCSSELCLVMTSSRSRGLATISLSPLRFHSVLCVVVCRCRYRASQI